MKQKNKNTQFLILTFVSVFISVISFSGGVLSPLFVLSGSIFVIIGYNSDIKKILISSCIYFLMCSIIINDTIAIGILGVLSPFYMVGFLTKKYPKDWTAFMIGFPLFALTISICLYSLNYMDLFNTEEFIRKSISQFTEYTASTGVKLSFLDENTLSQTIKNSFPAAILISSIFTTLININIATIYLRRSIKNFSFIPFQNFSLSAAIYLPMILFMLAVYLDLPGKDYLTIVYNNIMTVFEFLIALQGLSVIFFMMKKFTRPLQTIFKLLMIIAFLYSTFIFSFLGFFDIMFNLRKLPKRR